MSSSVKEVRTGNRILSLLLHEEYKRLLPHLELVQLGKNEILYLAGDHINHVYFPVSGMISLLSTTESGASIEVAMVGNEGMLGVPVILGSNRIPYEAMTQTTVDAYKIESSMLREEFEHSEHLRKLLLKYVHVLLTQISQSVVCSRFHPIQKRLCRWLLVARDVMKLDQLDLTQEIISHVLGIPRTGVTMAAVELQRAGFISYSRGHITILNQQELESASCECYRLVKDGFTGLIG